jgi:hypothetical protein
MTLHGNAMLKGIKSKCQARKRNYTYICAVGVYRIQGLSVKNKVNFRYS